MCPIFYLGVTWCMMGIQNGGFGGGQGQMTLSSGGEDGPLRGLLHPLQVLPAAPAAAGSAASSAAQHGRRQSEELLSWNRSPGSFWSSAASVWRLSFSF